VTASSNETPCLFAWASAFRGAHSNTSLVYTKRSVVLLIDDSEDQLDLYELVLEDCYRVLQAGHGRKDLELALSEEPDMIVCDLAMPGLDGWEVCRRPAANPRTASIPVIILTATSDPGLEDRAATIGTAAVLTTPCPVEVPRPRIDDALNP
jgi:putative two-component system response regulator